ncbi:hypothetical protein [Oceaniglobus trochenteri]|uniref:hypothetical protein n=1 Tax=Oceaniglobus trochenteri TaxID=2763260 RepID=UPI001D0007A1|nr:hypothetical protein [Oceaniglobus trochenteri]
MDSDLSANDRAKREIERLWTEADERAKSADRECQVMDLARKFVASVCAYEDFDVSVRNGSLGLSVDVWFKTGATVPASTAATSQRETFQRSVPLVATRSADPVPAPEPGPAPGPAGAPADTAPPDPAPEQDDIPAGPPAMGAAAVADGAGPDDGGPEPVASALPEAGGDASPSPKAGGDAPPPPELTPAAAPYSPAEETQILKMHDARASNGEIAAALGRRAQGFHHVVTRLVDARKADAARRLSEIPANVSVNVWQHLDKLGNTRFWTQARDLELAELIGSGMKPGNAAQLLDIEPQDAIDRWHALCPNRTVVGAIADTVKTLKARAR